MVNHSRQWQLKGNSPKIYDQHIAPAVSAPWYPLLIKAGLPYMRDAIADIGCATGSFLLHLADHKKISNKVQLVGIELNPAMLAVAKEKFSTSKNSISWVETDAKSLPFPNAYFNLVYCQQSIQYFEDKIESLKEIHRVIDVGGALIATTWSNIENCIGYKCLSDAMSKIVGDGAKSNLYAPFSYPNPVIFKKLAENVGFKSVTVQIIDNFVRFPSIKEFVWRRIYGSPLIENLPQNNIENVINEIVLELESSLKLYQGDQGLSFPVKANYLIATK